MTPEFATPSLETIDASPEIHVPWWKQNPQESGRTLKHLHWDVAVKLVQLPCSDEFRQKMFARTGEIEDLVRTSPITDPARIESIISSFHELCRELREYANAPGTPAPTKAGIDAIITTIMRTMSDGSASPRKPRALPE